MQSLAVLRNLFSGVPEYLFLIDFHTKTYIFSSQELRLSPSVKKSKAIPVTGRGGL
jgi:hypothetical protein